MTYGGQAKSHGDISMAGEGTGRESDKFMLRLPDGMRDRIAETARAAGRSMNAEIVSRLQASFDEESTGLRETIIRKVADEAAKAAVLEIIDTFEGTNFRLVKSNDKLTLIVDETSEKEKLQKNSKS